MATSMVSDMIESGRRKAQGAQKGQGGLYSSLGHYAFCPIPFSYASRHGIRPAKGMTGVFYQHLMEPVVRQAPTLHYSGLFWIRE